jgi:NAD(P)-dependent dehydrogenase (short-subunit alcohol dehydrogenase family)
MRDGTFVVTGATSGIGLALAHALARTAKSLVIVGRDADRVRAATAELARLDDGSPDLLPIVADLATIEGSESLAEQLEGLAKIDVLIHNAAVLPAQRKLTPDGFEESFATNHLAPFILNHRLRRRLVASAPARVVQVSAGLALGASVDLDGDPRGARFEPMSTYATTKRWNLLATLDFAAELQGSGVTVNLVHPGVVRTQLGVGAPGVPGADARRGWLAPEMGAEGPLYLATDPELVRMSGRFFDQREERPIRVPVDLQRAVVRRTAETLGERGSDLSRRA